MPNFEIMTFANAYRGFYFYYFFSKKPGMLC